MSERDNLLAGVAREFTILTDPILEAAGDPVGVYQLLSRMGWDLEPLIDADLAAVETAARAVISAFETVATKPINTLEDALEVLDDLTVAVANLDEVRKAITALTTTSVSPVVSAALFEDLLTYLLLRYVERRAFTLLQIAILLTLVEPEQADPLNAQGGTAPPLIRLPRRRGVIRLDRLPKLLADPVKHLREAYIPANGVATQAEAEQVANTLLRRIRNVVLALGGTSQVALEGASPSEQTAAANAELRRSVTVAFGGREIIDVGSGPVAAQGLIGVTASVVPADTQGAPNLPGPGLAVTPFGIATISVPVDTWTVGVTAGGSPGSVFITSTAVALTGAGAGLDARLTVSRSAEAAVPLVFGGEKGTRFELDRIALTVETHLTAAQQDYGIVGEIGKAALVIAAGDGDGFLQRVLPPEGVRTEFELGLGWSQSRGLTFRGSAGLDATFPIGKDIGGVVRIEKVHLSVHPRQDSVEAIVGTTVSVQLGPIKAAVERFGLTAQLTFREIGNLGPANLALTFQPPAGAALEIDAGVVTGGGYLLFDPARAQYAGAVHLEVAKKLNITAFGLLTTRMPDGSPGFSLLVLISVKFTPGVPLGYGFTLTGIGGLLGVNRTVAVDPLRAGLRGGTIGRILFPDDPVRNAPQIVSDLQTIFPPAPGRFVFGPMVQMTWGTPKPVLTIDLGLALELPAPVRLVILGRLRVLLPDAQAAVVRLQLDSLGVIDFENGDVALDAILYDSQISQFAVTGEMALRANFGARPNFVLAVGGFHPRFQAPEGFPALGRVAIALAAGNNPRLRLDAYLALTTNTVQFGAHVDLYAEAAGFNIQGYLGFDTLIQFSPFGLLAEIRAAVALKRGTTSIMCVTVELTLTGPAPWRAQGRANFTVLFLSGSIRFDVQFGRAAPPEMPAPAQVTPLLLAALRDAGNWGTQLPTTEHPVAAIRDTGSAALYVHPLADLQVRQRVVPLGREITRFGSTAVAGDRRFTVAVLAANDTVLTDEQAGVTPVDDLFAPAQFTDMTDDEKLVAPAFEPMQAGIRFGVRSYIAGAGFAEEEMSYERKTLYGPAPGTAREFVRDQALASGEVTEGSHSREADVTASSGHPGMPRPRPPQPRATDPHGLAPRVVRPGFIERVAGTGAAGRAPLDRAGVSKYAAPRRAIALKPPRFVAATGRGAAAKPVELPSHDGKPGRRVSGSYAETAEAMRLPRDPRQRRRLHVVPSYIEVIK